MPRETSGYVPPEASLPREVAQPEQPKETLDDVREAHNKLPDEILQLNRKLSELSQKLLDAEMAVTDTFTFEKGPLNEALNPMTREQETAYKEALAELQQTALNTMTELARKQTEYAEMTSRLTRFRHDPRDITRMIQDACFNMTEGHY